MTKRIILGQRPIYFRSLYETVRYQKCYASGPYINTCTGCSEIISQNHQMYMGSGILELHQLKVFSFKRSYRTSRVNNMGAELKNILQYAKDNTQLMPPYEAVSSSFGLNFLSSKLFFNMKFLCFQECFSYVFKHSLYKESTGIIRN